MRVLLTEGSGLTSRQVAARLRAAGHEVGVLSSDPIFLTRFTNATSAWHRVPPFGPDPFGWLDAAVRVHHEHRYDLLFPTQEQVTVLAASAERLRRDEVATIVPPFEALAAVQDKVSAAATLERLELPQPPSTVLSDHDALAAFDGFPVFLKLPIGTASGGVGLVRTRRELDALVSGWDLDEAFALGGPLAQVPADGPLAMVQSVFDQGRLVGFHANLRVREGARGGASHKRSFPSPAAREVIEHLGHSLGWHGALSADVILTEVGPVVIDVNPRLVEPNNAWFAGVDLVGAMVALSRHEHPPTIPPGRRSVATHQLLLAMGGAAQDGRGRRGIAAELAGAITRRGSYHDSREELTPLRGDLLAAVPLVLAASVTLARPSAWTWFSGGSVSNYALSPAGWREITTRRAAAVGAEAGRTAGSPSGPSGPNTG
jgi:glutathione synthase/RimK-type ligase-like ATP-grasp enzyme